MSVNAVSESTVSVGQAPGPTRTRRYWIGGTVVAGICTVLLLILAPSLGLGWGIAYHRSCSTGPVIESEFLWTPFVVVDSPFGGTGNATAITFQNDSTTVRQGLNASNGQVSGLFNLDNWTIQRATEVWVAGPGSNEPCSSPLVAIDTYWSPAGFNHALEVHSWDLLGAGNRSDTGVPTSLNLTASNGTSFPSVTFDYRFVPGLGPENYYTFGTCGSPGGGGTSKTSDTLDMGIPGTVGGKSVLVNVTHLVPTTYTYTFPPHGGNYTSLDLSTQSGSSGGGLAFSYSPCWYPHPSP